MSNNQCIDCGRGIATDKHYCSECLENMLVDRELAMSMDSDILHNETECEMCGKEGATRRKTGEIMCSTCYMVWTS